VPAANATSPPVTIIISRKASASDGASLNRHQRRLCSCGSR
jgi:hypothetical protein